MRIKYPRPAVGKPVSTKIIHNHWKISIARAPDLP
jgi:hypothetical protein